MKSFRTYMVVGGMPQAVDAYVSGKSYEQIDVLFRHGIRGYVERIPKTQETGCGYGIYVPQGADAAERILLENHVRVLRRMEHEEDLV